MKQNLTNPNAMQNANALNLHTPSPKIQLLIDQFLTSLNQEFTSIHTHEPILKLLSCTLTRMDSVQTNLLTFTFENLLTTQTDDPTFLNMDDIEDINGITFDHFHSFPTYATHSVTPIACTDTANPYQAIIITLSIEY